ncbi:Ion channel [Carpediemonas membranifera]|uniref:Ion channel n=1 Tax=Carpediemonas membranifera TaxID=201153 RepID=A0A8J6B968_9EUKA|nr:Ion channel [Carpediemonas membranifera]|eukprot:KAG9395789.1 Ion channel [Carpediemonas membranifera]
MSFTLPKSFGEAISKSRTFTLHRLPNLALDSARQAQEASSSRTNLEAQSSKTAIRLEDVSNDRAATRRTIGPRMRLRMLLERHYILFLYDVVDVLLSAFYLAWYVYMTSTYAPSWGHYVQFGLAVVFLVDTIIRFIIHDPIAGVTRWMPVNILSWLPALLLIGWSDMITLCFLRSVIIALLCYRYFTSDAKSLKDTIRNLVWVASTTAIVAAGVIYVFEVQLADGQSLDYLTCLYFIIVSVTTVGYGDVVMVTFLGRATIVLIILGGLSLLPVLSARIVGIMGHKKLYGDPKASKHGFVVVGGDISASNLRRFLKEFYSPQHGYRREKVVLLLKDTPGDDVESILSSKRYKERVSFLRGSFASEDAITKLKLHSADAVFVVQDHSATVDDKSDSRTVLTSLQVARAAPSTRLFLHTKRVSSPVGHVIPTSWLIDAVMSEGARVPGLANMILNLTRSFSSSETSPHDDGANPFRLVNLGRSLVSGSISHTRNGDSLSQSMHRSDRSPGEFVSFESWRSLYSQSLRSRVFRTAIASSLDGFTFSEAAHRIYRHTGAFLLAVEVSAERGRKGHIHFFTGRSGKVYSRQVAYVIASDTSHASAVRLIGLAEEEHQTVTSLPLTNLASSMRRDHNKRLSVLRRRWAEDEDADIPLAEIEAVTVRDGDTARGASERVSGLVTEDSSVSLSSSGSSTSLESTSFDSDSELEPTYPQTHEDDAHFTRLSDAQVLESDHDSTDSQEYRGGEGEETEAGRGTDTDIDVECISGHTIFVGSWHELAMFVRQSDPKSHPTIIWLTEQAHTRNRTLWNAFNRVRRVAITHGNPMTWLDWLRANVRRAQSVVVAPYLDHEPSTPVVIAQLLRDKLGAVAKPLIMTKIFSISHIRVLSPVVEDRLHFCPLYVQGSVTHIGSLDSLMAMSFYNPHQLKFLHALCLSDTAHKVTHGHSNEDLTPPGQVTCKEAAREAVAGSRSVLSRQVITVPTPRDMVGKEFKELFAGLLARTPSLLCFAVYRPVNLMYDESSGNYDPEEPLGVPILGPHEDFVLNESDVLICFQQRGGHET